MYVKIYIKSNFGLLTANKWHAVIDNPIASGAEPLMSDLLSSHTPKTVKTKTKVIRNSIPKAWLVSIWLLTAVIPKAPLVFSGVTACKKNIFHFKIYS